MNGLTRQQIREQRRQQVAQLVEARRQARNPTAGLLQKINDITTQFNAANNVIANVNTQFEQLSLKYKEVVTIANERVPEHNKLVTDYNNLLTESQQLARNNERQEKSIDELLQRTKNQAEQIEVLKILCKQTITSTQNNSTDIEKIKTDLENSKLRELTTQAKCLELTEQVNMLTKTLNSSKDELLIEIIEQSNEIELLTQVNQTLVESLLSAGIQILLPPEDETNVNKN